jgi:hypothetical protein
VTAPGPVFFTLGPSGTCHEHALALYLRFQGVGDASIELVDDLLDALEVVRRRPRSFLLQNSAHQDVGTVTERYCHEVFVVDTFICPTKPMAVLRRRDVERPRTLALMPATKSYVDEAAWESVVFERAKPLIGEGLLAGAYDAGLTHREWAERFPDQLAVLEEIGCVDTAWLVYGRVRRAYGDVLGVRCPEIFAAGA